MPFGTEKIDLDEAVQRLEAQRADLAETLEEADADSPVRESLSYQLQETEARLRGVRWARDDAHDDDRAPAWDEDVDSLTFAGLTGGEYGQVEDDLVGRDSAGPGATRVYLVAKGTVEAPYVDDDMGDTERIAAAANLPVPFLKWAEARVNDIMSLGGGGDMLGDTPDVDEGN